MSLKPAPKDASGQPVTRETMLAVGRRTFQIEAEALTRAGAALDESFLDAVELILAAKGRVCVTGIGKSGHIARKIAATLASTGTPAQFVHAAEASHGDLGMIGPGDMILALSNSGETSELADIVGYGVDHGIPIIALTGNAASTLARAARVAIVMPSMQEACPNGLAPTTSTTAMAAYGDALAMAAMTARRATPADFRRYHPGGRLGARLQRVRDLMHTGDALPIIGPDTAMRDAILTISNKGFGVAIVLDPATSAFGIITDGDMRRHIEILWHSRAADIASPSPVTIDPDSSVEGAARLMSERKITCLVVVDEQRQVVGLLQMHDCIRAGVTIE